MATHLKLGHAVITECRGTVLIELVTDVIQLVLDQGAELGLGALGAVVTRQGDEELGLFAEPVTHLLLLASLLPSASSEHQLLGLAKHHPPLLTESARRPQDADVGVYQVGVIWVVDAADVGEDLALYPIPNTGGRA
ncbi:hypothetical protein D3C76_1229940 [compost metagenome]